jgi:DNA-binding HxlR family transcriptional regulator
MGNCPLSGALRLIGGKWKIPVLCALARDGTTRYKDLKSKIAGITTTMLATTLRELEEDGLVSRKQYLEIPARVEYSLMPLCDDLLPIINQFARWGVKITNTKAAQDKIPAP